MGPECPEDNLRELTRDSKPNCGIAKEEKRKERERERERELLRQPGPFTERRIEQTPEES